MKYKAKRFNEAGRMWEEALALSKSKLGMDHIDTFSIMKNLGRCYGALGRTNDGERLIQEALNRTKATFGPDHPFTIEMLSSLAAFYFDARRMAEAITVYEQSSKHWRTKFGPNHPAALDAMGNLAVAYVLAERIDKALPLSEELLNLRKAQGGLKHADTITALSRLAWAHWKAKQRDKSIPLFEETLRLRPETQGANHPDTVLAKANLGVNYYEAARFHDANPLLEDAYRADVNWVARALQNAYAAAGRTDDLAALRRELGGVTTKTTSISPIIGAFPNNPTSTKERDQEYLKAIYRSIQIVNARLELGPYAPGDTVTIVYELKNAGSAALQVPVDRNLRLAGFRQHWIERQGSDSTIAGINPRVKREGTRYAAGGLPITTTESIPAGKSFPFRQQIKTAGYPPGKYTYYIEYQAKDNTVIRTVEVHFDLESK